MKHLFTKYPKNACLGALFPQKFQGIFNLLFIVLLVLMMEATQAQRCSSASMDPLSSGISKVGINVKIDWSGTLSAEEKITLTGSLASLSAIRKNKVGNLPITYSRKDKIDFDTPIFIGSLQVAAFAVRTKNPNTL